MNAFIKNFQKAFFGYLAESNGKWYKAIECIYATYPNQGELFYSHLLLTVVKDKIDYTHTQDTCQ